MRIYSVSVGELCAMSMLSGSIDNRFSSHSRLMEGIRLHQYIQSKYGPDDLCEQTMDHRAVFGDVVLEISGRADGILDTAGDPMVEEIKSTTRDLSEMTGPNPGHLAQCRCYSYIYMVHNDLDSIRYRVTYIFAGEKHDLKCFEYRDSREELEKHFLFLAEEWIRHITEIEKYEAERNEKIKAMKFPFEFRMYQKETINRIYRVIKEGKNVFMNAPTGSGKTLNSLYPAIKAMPYLNHPKIFYLTAKSTQKAVALNALSILRKKGLPIRSLVLTAKEKACRLDVTSCNPQDCPYALDYYDKLRDRRDEMLGSRKVFDAGDFQELSEEHIMCPFEMSLDFSEWADVIICDYNYVFDPSAALKRYFEEDAKGDYIFLVDEAHNLPERSRQMYSEVISRSDLLKLKKTAPTLKVLSSCADEILDCMAEWQRDAMDNDAYIFREPSTTFYMVLSHFCQEADRFLSRAKREDERYSFILDMYFNITKFMSIWDLKNDSHVFYYDVKEEFLKLFCTDAREYLSDILKKGQSAVFFSATLTPLDYYCEILGGARDDYLMNVKSSFDPDNFRIAVDTSIKTTYQKRAMYYAEAAERINTVISSKRGNYIVYFPSYAYLESVYEEYKKLFEDEVLVQTRGLDENARKEFLANFTSQSAVTAFAVIGGVFSEAVDLVGDKLIGAVICGVSLPMICTERELIRNHYDETGRSGFDYAYVYPGMNKVLQAMGRVIRTQDDKGCAVLLDERFRYSAYRKCFPPHYGHMVFVNSGKQLKQYLDYAGAGGEFSDEPFYEEE
ncbi:MAG: ATP-dependent DNA helicase [Eubacteriaceae bacterium]|nr:ATP-dependent DNA helicase [Eubacteriaceae bacterium]